MIKILERGSYKASTIRCDCCNSLLEYSSHDTFSTANPVSDTMREWIICPVCENEVITFLGDNPFKMRGM